MRIWEDCLPGLDLSRLVFLDECGINTLMARFPVAALRENVWSLHRWR